MNALLKTQTLATIIIIALAGGMASADTIDTIGTVTYGNLQFSDFSVSGPSGALSGVAASNVDVVFVANGDQVTLQFTPTASYGSDWSAAPVASGNFVVSYKVTAINNMIVQDTGLNLDQATAGVGAYVSVVDSMYRDAAETDLVSDLVVQTGFGTNRTSRDLPFNNDETSLYIDSQITIAALSEGGSLGQFSQSFTTATPEPGTLGVMGIGGLGVMLARRRSRKNRK